MTMLDAIGDLLDEDDVTLSECRRCGTTLRTGADECRRCGSGDIAHYDW